MSLADKFSPIHVNTQSNGPNQPKKLKDLTRTEMHALINSLGPKTDMLAGIALFHRIVDETYNEKTKCAAFLKFMQKAQQILPSGKNSEI